MGGHLQHGRAVNGSCERQLPPRPKEPGAINGGIWKGDQNDKPVIVLTTKDLDGQLKKLQKAGGKVVSEKTKVGDMDWYAKFQDTEGNVLGL